MQAVITLKECLELMRSGEPFDLVWITADRQRRRGGEILTAQGAEQPLKRGGRDMKQREPGSASPPGRRAGDPAASAPRNPNHYAAGRPRHGTRNIRLATGKIRKVHIQLIDSINGMKVV